ncbi:MAG: hypothetical protein WC736_07275 [Gallionella sp.]
MYEPDLDEVIKRNIEAERLRFLLTWPTRSNKRFRRNWICAMHDSLSAWYRTPNFSRKARPSMTSTAPLVSSSAPKMEPLSK